MTAVRILAGLTVLFFCSVTGASLAASTIDAKGVAFLIGSWRCTTFVGTKLTHRYARAKGGVMLVRSRVSLPNRRVGFIRERYRYHPESATWTVALAKGSFVARAPAWVGDVWSFTGRTLDAGKPVPAQMVYEALGADAFRRDFERLDGDGWQSYAGETCRRLTVR